MSYDALTGTFQFVLSIDNHPSLGEFSEVNGLAATVTTETIKEGGVNGYAIQLPSATTFPNLVLKRGIVSSELFDWVMEYRETGMISKRNITVFLLDHSGDRSEPIREWHFYNAWPIKWNGPSLNATSSAIAMESVEFVHEGIHKGEERAAKKKERRKRRARPRRIFGR